MKFVIGFWVYKVQSTSDVIREASSSASTDASVPLDLNKRYMFKCRHVVVSTVGLMVYFTEACTKACTRQLVARSGARNLP
jgi:hypothetical protein